MSHSDDDRWSFSSNSTVVFSVHVPHTLRPEVRPRRAVVQKRLSRCAGFTAVVDSARPADLFRHHPDKTWDISCSPLVFFLESTHSKLPGTNPRPGGGSAAFHFQSAVAGKGYAATVSCSDRKILAPYMNQLRQVEQWRFLCVDREEMKEKKKHILKQKVRAGIPDCLRGVVWQLLADVQSMKKTAGYEPDLYARLVASSGWTAGSPTNLGPIIARDINRTFPKHVLFRDIHQKGQQALFNVLKAYAIFNPDVGQSCRLLPRNGIFEWNSPHVYERGGCVLYAGLLAA
ncbi:tbc domain-containing protein [Cystoisospora suis]|uniref:Tbc domain-containing protein n=1 Tax=Cystoisospora suis TaxID=483139 RepID=A0A2C6KEB1_9APIC|nr:tbc domain-containing protein [Cystoisospora suis]